MQCSLELCETHSCREARFCGSESISENRLCESANSAEHGSVFPQVEFSETRFQVEEKRSCEKTRAPAREGTNLFEKRLFEETVLRKAPLGKCGFRKTLLRQWCCTICAPQEGPRCCLPWCRYTHRGRVTAGRRDMRIRFPGAQTRTFYKDFKGFGP